MEHLIPYTLFHDLEAVQPAGLFCRLEVFVALPDKCRLSCNGREMKMDHFGQFHLPPDGCAVFSLTETQRFSQLMITLLKSFSHLPDLSDPGIGRVDGAPRCQVVIRKTNHRGFIAGWPGMKQVGCPHMLRSVIQCTNMVRVFCKSG